MTWACILLYILIFSWRYYLLIKCLDIDPEEFANRFPSKLDLRYGVTSDEATSSMPSAEIVKLEKEHCTESVVKIRRTKDHITVTSRTNEETTSFLSAERNVWLVFELYGVRVKIEEETLVEGCQNAASDEGCVEADTGPGASRLADPVNLQEPIRQNFTSLLNSLEIKELLDHLYEENILTERELDELHEADKTRATRRLLVNILSKRPVSKKALEKALKDTKQDFLIGKFFSEAPKE